MRSPHPSVVPGPPRNRRIYVVRYARSNGQTRSRFFPTGKGADTFAGRVTERGGHPQVWTTTCGTWRRRDVEVRVGRTAKSGDGPDATDRAVRPAPAISGDGRSVSRAPTFGAWLIGQGDRDDAIGDLSRDVRSAWCLCGTCTDPGRVPARWSVADALRDLGHHDAGPQAVAVVERAAALWRDQHGDQAGAPR